MFRNTGTLRSLTYNEVRLPFVNSGLVEAVGNRLWWKNGATFANGSMDVASAAEAMWTGGQLKLEGLNTISGAGNSSVDSAAVVFAPGAKLNAGLFTFLGNSSVSGAGELNVSTDLRFAGSGFNTTINGTPIRQAEGGSGRLDIPGGILRFDNNALLELAGTFDIIGSNPTIATDGTGDLRVPASGKMVFQTSAVFPLELTLKGQITVNDGRTATFNAGGLFETAKLLLNGPDSNITFTGTAPWTTTGNAVEFAGTGTVNFADTTLHFDDRDPGTTADDATIAAGTRVAFQGTNLIDGAGELSTTGFVFQNGSSTTVDRVALKTTGTANNSVWNGNGGSLEFKNGARFLNGGRFVIQSQVGTPFAPGIKGEAGTLFFNTPSGRIVHDSNSQTDFNIDFQNEGVLEFSRGTVNFLKRFSGTGGLAASNGAKVSLSMAGVTLDQLPTLLQTIGGGSEISILLPGYENMTIRLDANGGRIVAAGGGNIVAAGGGNIVAAGGGNIVAAGGGNIVAAGGGNLTATGLASLLQANGIVAAGGGNILSHNGGLIVAAGGGNILSHNGGLMTANGGTIRSEGSAPIVAAGGGNILSHNGGLIVAAGGGNMVAAGGGNIVAAGGGNIVAAGGGNMVAAGGGNLNGGMVEMLSARTAAARAKLETAKPVDGEPTSDNSRAEMMQRYSSVNGSTTVGMITVEAGGNATAQNGGQIVAESGGALAGAGTFTGPGVIQGGGAMMPLGRLTWTGNLTFDSGSLLDVEIGGPTAGTQHDVVNVSGAVVMSGTLNIRFVNGFGNVQPSATFDVVTAGSPITTALNGTRVSVFGTNSSFEVQLVNGGNTLRLTNYQSNGPITFSSWASNYGLTGAAAAMTADPNNNGVSNLLEYALGLDPTAIGGPSGITIGKVTDNGSEYLSLSYTRPTGADARPDVNYSPERASSLARPDWSSAATEIIPFGVVPGPGNLETVTVRSTHPISATNREFLRLRVTLTP